MVMDRMIRRMGRKEKGGGWEKRREKISSATGSQQPFVSGRGPFHDWDLGIVSLNKRPFSCCRNKKPNEKEHFTMACVQTDVLVDVLSLTRGEKAKARDYEVRVEFSGRG